MSANEICFMSAKEMADRIRKKELSCREVMEAHLAQIDRVNPKVNAIVTRIEPEEALIKADVADRIVARGDELGPLHGLPIAHKDLVPTKGLRTTFGSPIFKDFMPDHDGLIVERLREAGTLLIGKTNTPEFGAGSQTYNEVFGETLNPYDTTRTCGGSSGGAAVSLACGMLPVADGSDMGGSLRNPANFNNIVGFRPSPGRVPQWPTFTGWSPLAVEGPMARSVEDLALLLSAIAGPDDRSPIALSEPGEIFRRSLDRDFKGVRIAWSPDLGGVPVDTRVADVLKSGIPVFEDLGCVVEEKTPDLTDADMIFKVLRAWCFEVSHHETIKSNRRLMKETVIWNIEEGQKLTGPEVGQAEVKKTELYHRVREFMNTYEFLLCPVNQVPPFDVKTRWIDEINGVKMDSYIDWMKTCYFITVTGHPAISVPCGFTPEGLPVGIQIVGRHRDDFGVLQLAHAFEKAGRYGERRPEIAV